MTHGEKVELLQDARATLFPIEWEEPFGLVMVESMACGTPVIATRHGAVPEVIEDGVSGIIVENYREMAAALEQADELDPYECRRYVEERFAPERMVRDYENAYRTRRRCVPALWRAAAGAHFFGARLRRTPKKVGDYERAYAAALSQ